MLLTPLLSVTESPGEGSREGDSTGVRFGHDPVQGAEATWEPWTAEVRWWGHHRGHQVPAGEAGRECAGSQVSSWPQVINSMQSLKQTIHFLGNHYKANSILLRHIYIYFECSIDSDYFCQSTVHLMSTALNSSPAAWNGVLCTSLKSSGERTLSA